MNAQTIQKEVIRNLGEIFILYPQYTVSEHLVHILRSKGGRKPYRAGSANESGWDDQYTLKQIEQYKEELLNELSAKGKQEEPD